MQVDVSDVGSIPGSGRSPGEGNGYPLQFLAWKIPWAEEPGGLQSMGLQRAGPDGSDLAHIRKTKERERETMVGFSVERFENYSCPEKRRGSREDVVGEWAGEGV